MYSQLNTFHLNSHAKDQKAKATRAVYAIININTGDCCSVGLILVILIVIHLPHPTTIQTFCKLSQFCRAISPLAYNVSPSN